MIPAETIPEMECGEGMNPNMIYLMHHKNFCKFHNVPPPSTIKIKM
jgi:hypothetical protein